MQDIFKIDAIRALRSVRVTTERLARVMRRDSLSRKRDFQQIKELNYRLARVIPIIPNQLGAAGVIYGIDKIASSSDFGLPPFPPFGGPPLGPGGPTTPPPTTPPGPPPPPKRDETTAEETVEEDTDVDTDRPTNINVEVPNLVDTEKDKDKDKDDDKERPRVPGREEGDDDQDGGGEEEVQQPEKPKTPEVVPQFPPLIPPPPIPKKEDEKERTREPVTAFIDDFVNFITAAPVAIRIEGLKLVQRIPKIVEDVNAWVQSDEFMDMIDPAPGTPDATDRFLDSLNIPTWAEGLIESLILSIGASRGRMRPTVRPLTPPIRTGPLPNPTQPVVRPPLKKVKTLPGGNKTTEPAAAQTIDVQPLTKSVQRGNVEVGGSQGAANPIPKTYRGSFGQQDPKVLQKRLEEIRKGRRERLLKDPTSDELNIIDALRKKGITVPEFNPSIGPQASAKTLIQPVIIYRNA